MALIKRADADQMARGAIVLDLGDLARQGAAIRRDAVSAAQRIRLEAERERNELVRGAAEEGREAGHAEGYAKGLEEGRAEGRERAFAEAQERLNAIDAAWTGVVDEFVAVREAARERANEEVLSLALTIARRITRRVVELDRGAVEGPLEAALELIAQGTRAVVSVHPDDEAAAREALPGLMSRLDAARDALLEADESVTRGSCVVRTPGGSVIDADLETQIDRIVSALRPGGAAP